MYLILTCIIFTQTVDKDQSGIITQEEYETFLKCIGKSKKVILNLNIKKL